MNTQTAMMLHALERCVLPILHDMGFTGSFPHYRRVSEHQIHLISFQFTKWGNGFTVEIAKCPLEGVTTSWGDVVPPDEVIAWDVVNLTQKRLLGPSGKDGDFHYFMYNAQSVRQFEQTARGLIPLLLEVEQWWKE